MKKQFKITLFALLASYALYAQTEHNCDPKAEAKYITTQVEVKGLVENPVALNLESLKKMKVAEVKNFNVTCQTGEVKKKIDSFKGVLLKDIIEAAKIKMSKQKERGKYFILISASDGYKVIFSYNELMFNTTGDHTYLVFEENGEEIKDEGKFIVMCTNDILTGPRHVKWVKSIEVMKVE